MAKNKIYFGKSENIPYTTFKNKLRYFLRRFANMLYSKVFSNDMEAEFNKIYEDSKNYTMTSKERMYALYKSTQYIINSKIPGDFVECGVWKGGSAMIMALSLLKMNETKRKIYLYDTFKGMTKPTEKDIRTLDSAPIINIWRKYQKKNHNKWYFSCIGEVKKNMLSTGYPLEKLIFVRGKVEDTIPNTMPSKIAILRLDTDWYESTYHELKYLFPLISCGGVIIIDDYGNFAGQKEAVNKYFKKNNIKILLNRIDYSCRLGIKMK